MTRFVTSDTGPFAIVPEWVLDSDLPDRAVRLYAILARYADEAGLAYPSRSTLASRLRCSLDSVDRAMAQLVKIGALTIARRVQNTAGEVKEGKRGPGWESTSSLYRLHRTVPAGLRLPSRTDEATGAAPVRRQEPQGCGPNENHLNENHLNEREAPASRPSKPRDLLWDAVAEVTSRVSTRAERTRRGAVINELLEAEATPAEVHRRAKVWHEKYPRIDLTDTALRSHWTRLGNGMPTAQQTRDQEYLEQFA